MPPKARITREMVIDAAFALARTVGYEQINARTLSQRLGCSTQPVMYHFSTIEEIRRAAYERADKFHSAYLLRGDTESENFILEIGLNYIRFAVHESNLFRFLFQSGYAEGNSLMEMMDSEELTPILTAMEKGSGIPAPQMKEIFVTVAMFVHGYASIIANNSMTYDETIVSQHLERAFRGAVLAMEEDGRCADG